MMAKTVKYKPSGLDWCPEIPEHWEVKKLKYAFQVIIGGVWGNEPIEDSDDLICIRVADFDYDKMDIANDNLTIRNIKTNEQKNRLLEEGDILLEKSGGGEKTPVGRAVLYNKDFKAVCSNFINRLKPIDKKQSRFLGYFLKAMYQNGLTNSFINQTTGIQNLQNEPFLNQYIFHPSKIEQQKIATFLDEKTIQIDHIIEKKQKLIACLKEERIAIINQAVTQGLNPDVEMKPSGIEWLGEIPKHWQIKKLKHVSKIINGATPSSSNENFWNGDIIWVTPVDVSRTVILTTSERKITEEGYLSCGTTMIPKSTIVITTRAPIGNVAIADVHLCTNQGCKSLIPDKIESKFLFYYFIAKKEILQMLGQGTTFTELSGENLSNITIPVPSAKEQNMIVLYIENQTSRIDQTIQKIEQEITLLQEYKTALINEVVTGKMILDN